MTLCADSISFGYEKGHLVIDDFSLSIEPGELVWLTGDSGVGKTTICKTLAGYEKPLSGGISVDENPLPDSGVMPVQLIGQHPERALDPRLTMQKSMREAGELQPGLMKRLGIKQEWLTRYPHELSGGELMRFCIYRALAVRPSYLIADEISTMLDLVSQADIWRVLQDEARVRNMGILFTTHSKALGKKLADRVVDLTAI